MNDQYHKALSEEIRQTIRDSEEDYVNETFWRVYPAFFLVKSGNVEALRCFISATKAISQLTGLTAEEIQCHFQLFFS